MTEIRIFGDHDDRTKEQMARCMQVGSVVGGVLCADGHLGYAQPVGGVIAYEEHVSVSGVGFDIACGNMAVKLDVPKADLTVKVRSNAKELLALDSHVDASMSDVPTPDGDPYARFNTAVAAVSPNHSLSSVGR